MKISLTVVTAICVLACFTSNSKGDLVFGVISDFQDGTVQGWDGGAVSNIANSGPLGAGDFSLQLSNGTDGAQPRFAMFNMGVNGAISPAVSSISSYIFRGSGAGAAEIRLVLFDSAGTRWTSTVAANVIDDGLWHNYSFSVRETDLSLVFGSGTYLDLVNDLERIMFRYDPGTPSMGGVALTGTMNFDNITAIPEPASLLVFVAGAMAVCARRRR